MFKKIVLFIFLLVTIGVFFGFTPTKQAGKQTGEFSKPTDLTKHQTEWKPSKPIDSTKHETGWKPSRPIDSTRRETEWKPSEPIDSTRHETEWKPSVPIPRD